MTEQESLFAEIGTLLQEQIKTLKAELLTPVEVSEYAERQKRIRVLAQRLCQSQPGAN